MGHTPGCTKRRWSLLKALGYEMSTRIAGQSDSTADFQLERDSFGRLVLIQSDGTRYVGATAVRGFPMSDPAHCVAILDAEGRELVWVDDLAMLPAEIRQVLESELREQEFLPQIRRIYSMSALTDPCQWDVETDRGRTSILIKNIEDVRPLDGRRALVTDAHGIRYLIEEPQSLDRNSRRILERYL
jgi:uncharacterized protein DUF1854